MATLLYSPSIRVHIESDTKGIIDVSDDITNFQLNRNVNAVSTFNFTLQNTQRKYDQVFKPSDRITVELKRITWVRVFTGSLNTVPIFSAWPRALSMSASCTLKKLQFWPWDPTTTAAADLINQYYSNGQQLAVNAGSIGLSQLVASSLNQVTGWDSKAIHIGQVPNNWFLFANQVETLISAAANMQAVLGSQATIAGQGVNANFTLPAGVYGQNSYNATQTGIAATIFSIARSQVGITDAAVANRAATIAVMTGLDESHLTNLTGGDRDSVGVFQQRPSQGWGTIAECENVQYATLTFFKHLLGINNWQTLPLQQAAQAVQRSAFKDGSNYAKFIPDATDMIAQCNALYNNASSKLTPGGLATTQTTPTKSTGNALASNAYALIQAHLNSPIVYNLGGDNPDTTPIASVTTLDCSSLVDWVYRQSTGNPLWKSGGRSTAGSIYAQCQNQAKLIPVDLARYVQGAVLFISDGHPNGSSDPHHIGVSLGDNTHVAAHDKYSDPKKDTTISPIDQGGGFNYAGLLPGIDYTKSATTQAAATQLQAILGTATTVSTGGFSSGTDLTATSTDNIFGQLVTALAAAPVVSGNIFGGARELINNSPFLPWLTNLVNASMRAFSSAPNGDFIAWFPDYFNIWGTAAVMNIQLIELQDFTIDWSDQQIVTHEFVIGSSNPIFDATSGGISDGSDQSYSGFQAMLSTQGVVTMEFPQIFQAIYGVPASQQFVQEYLERFGARPNVDQMSNIFYGQAEFYMALWNFMFYWSAQFSTQIPMTFMPELFPGMILKIPEYDFQCYVQSVQHSGSFGENGQFTTTATVIAPARTSSKTDLFGLLPLGGVGGT